MPKQQKRRLLLLAGLLLVFLLAVAGMRAGFARMDEGSYPQKYSEYVEYYAGKYSLDPLMLYAVIRTESGFDPDARSGVDARGLMQITEETFQWIKSRIAPDEEIAFEDLYDPETNIRFGSYYFTCCLERYQNDLATAAAAYHSGWGTVDALLSQTGYSQDGATLYDSPYVNMNWYMEKIRRSYARYQALYAQQTA